MKSLRLFSIPYLIFILIALFRINTIGYTIYVIIPFFFIMLLFSFFLCFIRKTEMLSLIYKILSIIYLLGFAVMAVANIRHTTEASYFRLPAITLCTLIISYIIKYFLQKKAINISYWILFFKITVWFWCVCLLL